MRRLLTGAVLILGSVSAMQAQEVTGAGAGQQPAASSNMATSPEVRFAPNAPLVAQVAAPLVPVRSAGDLLDANFASAPTASTSETVASNTDIAVPGPVPSAALSGDPEPAPDPKFLYGGRDDSRDAQHRATKPPPPATRAIAPANDAPAATDRTASPPFPAHVPHVYGRTPDAVQNSASPPTTAAPPNCSDAAPSAKTPRAQSPATNLRESPRWESPGTAHSNIFPA